MGTTPKRKGSDTPPVISHVTPKRRCMRILDDDITVETEASAPEREDVCDVGDTHEDLDEDNYYDCDKDAFVHSDVYPEEQGGLDTPSRLAGSTVHRISIEPILGISHVLFPFHSLKRELPIHHSSLFCRLPIFSRAQTLPLLTLHKVPKRYALFAPLIFVCTCLVRQSPFLLPFAYLRTHVT
ncbi:hypothetical protein L3X38_032684 [Prunus dulcis]|uniref:Uncharacterized protein n=1 Tax=Prunus dulcis TaxID=3755 RepID=A0AAD4VGU4_PRUDU|nr:hypothetical protein L3X38_032684 [Prunus dulcis]